MTRAEIQSTLQLSFNRKRWLDLLGTILPQTQKFARPQALGVAFPEARSAIQLATVPLADGRNIAVIRLISATALASDV